MRFSLLFLAAMGATSVAAAGFTLVCDPPATLTACRRDCDPCTQYGQPDCGHTVCHEGCRCREATPPPPYVPPPPYSSKSSPKSSKSSSSKKKGGKRSAIENVELVGAPFQA
ncbi:hypothetical protein B0O99DRAFT_679650 [Bisporella sp. PMI_857]|nr:hypothetical protein B0O99DRAFT_679650 [Bisporella sp. PMI_857]